MAKLFDAVQRFRKVEEVCSTKDDLPPVYLMDEIADLSKESAENAQSVAEHVARNLANKSPVVKWKVIPRRHPSKRPRSALQAPLPPADHAQCGAVNAWPATAGARTRRGPCRFPRRTPPARAQHNTRRPSS